MQKSAFPLFFVCAITVATAFTGCKKDSSDNNQQKLVGKWTFQKVYMNFNISGLAGKDTTTFNGSDYLQFNADGTGSFVRDGQSSSGTWELKDGKLVMSESNDMDSPLAYDVKSVTGTDLHLYDKEGDGDNFVETTTLLTK